jgi:hypothetical protein
MHPQKEGTYKCALLSSTNVDPDADGVGDQNVQNKIPEPEQVL